MISDLTPLRDRTVQQREFSTNVMSLVDISKVNTTITKPLSLSVREIRSIVIVHLVGGAQKGVKKVSVKPSAFEPLLETLQNPLSASQSVKIDLPYSAHSLLPHNAGWEGIEILHWAVICILGSKILVHQISTIFSRLDVVQL